MGCPRCISIRFLFRTACRVPSSLACQLSWSGVCISYVFVWLSANPRIRRRGTETEILLDEKYIVRPAPPPRVLLVLHMHTLHECAVHIELHN